MTKTEENKETSGKLEQFFDVLGNKSPSAKSGYKTAIWMFIKFVFNLTDADKGNCPAYLDQYFASNPNVATDFKKFVQVELKNKAPLGALQVFNQLNKFFRLTDAGMTAREIQIVKNQLPSGGVQSEDGEISTDLIRAMMQHTDIKGKAVLLMLATTGVRIGELLKIKCTDVHFPTADVPMTHFTIRAKDTKNGQKRFVFCTTECTEAVREWIKVRGDYLTANAKRGLGLKNRTDAKDTSDDRLFPMSIKTVTELLAETMIKVTGSNARDEVTNRSLMHPHLFRKFFATQLSGEMNKDVIEYLLGHWTNLDNTYKKGVLPAQFVEQYMNAQHRLFIESPAEIRKAASQNQTQINSLKDTSLTQTQQLLSLMIEKDALREQVRKQNDEMQQMKGEMQNLHAAFMDTLNALKDYQTAMRAAKKE